MTDHSSDALRAQPALVSDRAGSRLAPSGFDQAQIDAACQALCKSGKFQTGQGTCALICMQFLGDPRKSGCGEAKRVHRELAEKVCAAALKARAQSTPTSED